MRLTTTIVSALAIGVSSLGLAARNVAPSGASQPAPADAKLTVSVEGVSCASCTLSIRRALKRLEGVKTVQAGSEPNQAVVTYDPDKVKPEQIVQTIDELGFKTRRPIKG
jgi:copper chaperone CopZ